MLVAAPTTPSIGRGWTKMVAPGVHMPWVSLGTCCGSDPAVGVVPWLNASTALFHQPVAGIDTAFDYNDQGAIADQLAAGRTPRHSVFITTKIPGAAFLHSDPKIVCPSKDFRTCALRAVERDLALLRITVADLVLVHDPGLANETGTTAALWQGMQDALRLGLARSIVREPDLNTRPVWKREPDPNPRPGRTRSLDPSDGSRSRYVMVRAAAWNLVLAGREQLQLDPAR